MSLITESHWQTVPIPVITVPTEGVEPAVPIDSGPARADETQPRRRRHRWLVGFIAFAFAVATIVAHTVAIVVASSGDWPAGIIWGYVAIGASIVGFVVGLLATIFGWGRRLGAIAMALSVLANPYLLLNLLSFFRG